MATKNHPDENGVKILAVAQSTNQMHQAICIYCNTSRDCETQIMPRTESLSIFYQNRISIKDTVLQEIKYPTKVNINLIKHLNVKRRKENAPTQMDSMVQCINWEGKK